MPFSLLPMPHHGAKFTRTSFSILQANYKWMTASSHRSVVRAHLWLREVWRVFPRAASVQQRRIPAQTEPLSPDSTGPPTSSGHHSCCAEQGSSLAVNRKRVWTEEKVALWKQGLNEKTAASVLLKLFIRGNERCHTTDATPLKVKVTMIIKLYNDKKVWKFLLVCLILQVMSRQSVDLTSIPWFKVQASTLPVTDCFLTRVNCEKKTEPD